MRLGVIAIMLLCIGSGFAEDGARYLVVTYDAYADAVRPLADWKQASGISIRVVRTSEIGSDTGSIRRYIYTAWSTWPVKPEYVLIVGSPSQIKARIYGQQQWRYYSDNYYADMTGDYQAELYVGRFPARSVADAQNMVAKTLAYEQLPDHATDSTWMLKTTTMANDFQDDDGPLYWDNARNLARLAGEHGFLACDSFSWARGHDSADVAASVNAGTGIVMYRGTAGGWWRYPFNINPYYTANDTRLPVVLSITCETMSLDPYDVLLCQYWMYAGTVANPAGAAAVFGNTVSASNVAPQRGAVARGTAAGLFTENLHRLGPITIRGKSQLIQEYPTDDEDYRGFNIMGDPTLPVWTGRPQLLDVTHPREILNAPQDVPVTVTHDGVPVAGAVVCLSMDTTVWSVDTTDAGGSATLAVAPADTGLVRIVVTGRNLVPFDGFIPVVVELGAAEPRPAAPIRVELAARPSVTNRAAAFTWTVPAASRLEVRDNLGRTVRSLDVRGRTGANWDGTDATGQQVRSGVYFCNLADAAGNALGTCRILRLQ